MARSVTRGQVKARARVLADVVNDPNISDAELNELFDLHLSAFYDILSTEGNQADFNYNIIQFTTIGGQLSYPLSSIGASDFLSLANLYAIEAAQIRRPIFPFTDKQKGLFKPVSAAYNMELEYIPVCPLLTDDSSPFDSVDRWDVYVSALMARDILVKRKQDPSMVMAIIDQAHDRILRLATRRLRGGPKFLEDAEATWSFFPPTVRVNGFRLRGNNIEIYELQAIGWP